jgi:hypothetical protein
MRRVAPFLYKRDWNDGHVSFNSQRGWIVLVSVCVLLCIGLLVYYMGQPEVYGT